MQSTENSGSIRTWQNSIGEGLATVAISDNGQIIVAGSLKNRVVCFNHDGQQLWKHSVGNQAWRAAISGDGQLIVIGTGSTRPWSLSGRGLHCFTADGKQLWQAELGVSIWGLALSKDGSTIGAATSDKHILLYDNRGHRLWQQDISGWEWNARAWCAALSHNGDVVSVGTADRTIRVLHKSGQLQAEYHTQGEVFATALSRDGTEVVAGDNRKQIYWLDQQGRLRWQAELEDKIWALALTEEGDRVVVGAGERETHVRMYSQSGELLWRRHVDGGVTNIDISRQPQRIIVGTRTGTIYLFDLNGEVLHKANAGEIVRDVAISANGQLATAVSEDGTIYGFGLPSTSIDSSESTRSDDKQIELFPISTPRGMKISETEQQILSALFVNARELRIISEFTDGRTATRVFLVRPTDESGIDALPAVIKVGPKELIEEEWQATRRHVLDRLPGFVPVRNVPAYIDHADGTAWGGLRYGQVGDGLFEAVSFAHFTVSASLHELWQVLENRLFRQLRQLWESTQEISLLTMQGSYDTILPVNLIVDLAQPIAENHPALLDAQKISVTNGPLPPINSGDTVRLENFIVTEIDLPKNEITINLPRESPHASLSYRLRVNNTQTNSLIAKLNVGEPLPTTVGQVVMTRAEMLREHVSMSVGRDIDPLSPTFNLPDASGVSLPNPLHAIVQLLQHKCEAKFGVIHGDLNLRNVLIDPDARTAHIIDSAAARRDHLLHDLLRFERDLLTDVLARTLFQAGLPPSTVHELYRWVHCATSGEPHASGHFALPIELPTALHKVYVILVIIRQTARDLLATPNQWDEYYAGLVIHLVGALKFKDLDQAPIGQQPKAIAFWAAATVCWLMEGGVDCAEIKWEFVNLSKKDDGHISHKNNQNSDDDAEQFADPSFSRHISTVDEPLMASKIFPQKFIENADYTVDITNATAQQIAGRIQTTFAWSKYESDENLFEILFYPEGLTTREIALRIYIYDYKGFARIYVCKWQPEQNQYPLLWGAIEHNDKIPYEQIVQTHLEKSAQLFDAIMKFIEAEFKQVISNDGNAERPASTSSNTHIDTGGGAYIAGDMNTTGGDFIGRDRVGQTTPNMSPEHGLKEEPERPLRVMRKAIESLFYNAQDLQIFCQDYFEDVARNLKGTDDFDGIVLRLLKHCDTRYETDVFWEGLKVDRPLAYDKWYKAWCNSVEYHGNK